MKSILVTGGNKGIGYGLCLTLLRDHPDVKVLLGARDEARGQAAVRQLQSDVGANSSADRVEFVLLDATSPESVAEAAAQFQEGSLYGLVNNAGVGNGLSQEVTFATNYWGVRNVTDAFLPKLQPNQGRIVNVSSGGGPYFIVALPEDDPLKKQLSEPWTIDGVEGLDGIAQTYKVKDEGETSWSAYGLSKALVNCYTYLLSRQHPNLVINSMTPGLIATSLAGVGAMGATKSPEEGAIPIVFCLFDPDVASSPQGRFYGSDCQRAPFHKARDPGTPAYDGPEGP